MFGFDLQQAQDGILDLYCICSDSIRAVGGMTHELQLSAIASIRVRYLFRFSAVTRNFPPASMPVQYHQDRCRSHPRNILVSVHCT
jgi:hypothetical protein